jgi:parvulin-like peptidyl-prolyl isomerase
MPSEIQETLQKLKTDEPLLNSAYYDKFLGDFLGGNFFCIALTNEEITDLCHSLNGIAWVEQVSAEQILTDTEQTASEIETNATRTVAWDSGSTGSTLGLYDGMVIIPPVYYMPLGMEMLTLFTLPN